MRWWFSNAFHYPIQLYIFYLLLWNYFLILNRYLIKNLLRILFCVIGRCSPVPASHWLQGKCARINLSQAASGMILQNHRRLPLSIFSVKIAALGSSKRVTGRTFKISIKFQRSKVKHWVWFFHQLSRVISVLWECHMCAGGLVQQVRVQPAGAGGAARPRGGRQLRHPPHARRNLLTDWDPAQAGDTTNKAAKIVFFSSFCDLDNNNSSFSLELSLWICKFSQWLGPVLRMDSLQWESEAQKISFQLLKCLKVDLQQDSKVFSKKVQNIRIKALFYTSSRSDPDSDRKWFIPIRTEHTETFLFEQRDWS